MVSHKNTYVSMYLFFKLQKGTLADELLKRESRNDPFHEHLALLIFLQICEGVQHMHQDEAVGGPFAHR